MACTRCRNGWFCWGDQWLLLHRTRCQGWFCSGQGLWIGATWLTTVADVANAGTTGTMLPATFFGGLPLGFGLAAPNPAVTSGTLPAAAAAAGGDLLLRGRPGFPPAGLGGPSSCDVVDGARREEGLRDRSRRSEPNFCSERVRLTGPSPSSRPPPGEGENGLRNLGGGGRLKPGVAAVAAALLMLLPPKANRARSSATVCCVLPSRGGVMTMPPVATLQLLLPRDSCACSSAAVASKKSCCTLPSRRARAMLVAALLLLSRARWALSSVAVAPK